MRIASVDHLDGLASLRPGWDTLYRAAAIDHPFACFTWFDGWYRAFCPPEAVRVFVAQDADGVRAIFPAYKTRLRLKGLLLPALAYAANGHSPRGGVLARPGDEAALTSVLDAAFQRYAGRVALFQFPALPHASDSWRILQGDGWPRLARRVENRFEAPGYTLPEGWDGYFAARPKKTRDRLKNNFSRARKMGKIAHHIFHLPAQAEEALKRLESLDRFSWQAREGEGLFTPAANDRFFRWLLAFDRTSLPAVVCITSIGGVDAAYALAVLWEGVAHVLKMGYDPAYATCSPGVLTSVALVQHATAQGIHTVDLGAGLNADKLRWETFRQGFDNLWLIPRDSLRGRALLPLVRLHDRWKVRRGGDAGLSLKETGCGK